MAEQLNVSPWSEVFGQVQTAISTMPQTTAGVPGATGNAPAQTTAGLSQEVFQGIAGLTGNQGAYERDGVMYQPVYGYSGGVEQGGGQGPLESVIAYNKADANQVGKSFKVYDPQGKYQRDGQFQEVNQGRDFMQALAGAAAIYGLGGMMTAGGAGGLAGETLSKAALDGTTAFGANSVPGAFELGSAGAGAGAAGAGAGGGSASTLTRALGVAEKVAENPLFKTGLMMAGMGGGGASYGSGEPTAEDRARWARNRDPAAIGGMRTNWRA